MSRDKRRRLMLLGALAVGGGALAVIASGTMDENGTTTSYTADATDVDAGDGQTYSIVGTGDDDQYFSIDANTGVLSLNGALDFENPNDANGD